MRTAISWFGWNEFLSSCTWAILPYIVFDCPLGDVLFLGSSKTGILDDAVCLHPVMVKHLGTYIWVALLTADPAASQAVSLELRTALLDSRRSESFGPPLHWIP